MELMLNVALTTTLINNKKTTKKYKSTRLILNKSQTHKGVWVLIIGKTDQKTIIEVTNNVVEIYSKFLEAKGLACVEFKNPKIQCLLSTVMPTQQHIKLLKQLLTAIKQCSPVGGHPVLTKEATNKKCFGKVNHFDPSSQTWKKIKVLFNLSENHIGLTVLNLEGRNLCELPNELHNLPLRELLLDNNLLGQKPNDWWSWLDGKLIKSLDTLSLNRNKISIFPLKIISCKNLKTLNLSGNDLSTVPNTLFSGNLSCIDLSQNGRLSALPFTRRRLHTLDLSGCTLLTREVFNGAIFKIFGKLSLLGLAGSAVRNARLPYSFPIIPRNLVLELNNAKVCDQCGLFAWPMRCRTRLKIPTNVLTIVSDTSSYSFRVIENRCSKCFNI